VIDRAKTFQSQSPSKSIEAVIEIDMEIQNIFAEATHCWNWWANEGTRPESLSPLSGSLPKSSIQVFFLGSRFRENDKADP